MSIADGRLPDWPRALGGPLTRGRIRQAPADFAVVEVLGWDPSGDGEHDFLRVEKTGQNTAWLAARLARHAGVAVRDVGYAGLKDRHAVTRQWFSVRRPAGRGTDWTALDIDGVRILDIRRHGRKLKRGSHRRNEFGIVIRDARVDPVVLAERLRGLSARGVPNYFGEQRFGNGGRNLELARCLVEGRRLKRQQQSIAISAARSCLFNDVLAMRVRAGTWDTGLAGDCFNLDGSNSIFRPDEIDDALHDRIAAMDVHPTGPLWGGGSLPCTGIVAEIESTVAGHRAAWTTGLESAGAHMGRRPLRARVDDLAGESANGCIRLDFSLRSGSYATSVLREIGEFHV